MGISSYENVKLRLSEDGMQAFLTLLPSSEDECYTKEQLVRVLQANKIVYGIDVKRLVQMCERPEGGREFCVARGMEPVDGMDGILTYKFDAEPSKKPTVSKDGSVDYRNIHLVEIVHKGDVIAVSTDPTEAKDGMRVTGVPIPARRGKPAPQLRGKGYSVSDDGHTYIAVLSGKIELVHGSVRISAVHEVRGDAGLESGNIDFKGDVIIHGNVNPGTVVKASGTITVDGICENCSLEAGKSILLRSGVLGGHKTVIRSAGDVEAKFFEYCKVCAEGSIIADSALDCELESYSSIVMTGKKGSLVGGSTYATERIEAHTIGNEAEIRTNVQVGVTTELLQEEFEADKQKEETEGLIAKINAGLKQYDEFVAEHGKDAGQEERRVALFRTRMMKQAELATIEKKLQRFADIRERGKGAAIYVKNEVYPGVTVGIDRFVSIQKEKLTSVQFELNRRGDNIVMLSLGRNYLNRN